MREHTPGEPGNPRGNDHDLVERAVALRLVVFIDGEPGVAIDIVHEQDCSRELGVGPCDCAPSLFVGVGAARRAIALHGELVAGASVQ